MGADSRASERDATLETALRAQRDRVLAALADEEPLEAAPILRADERLDCESYVTLVYEFHHVVLPELEADGLACFDREADAVTRGDRFDAAVARAGRPGG